MNTSLIHRQTFSNPLFWLGQVCVLLSVLVGFHVIDIPRPTSIIISSSGALLAFVLLGWVVVELRRNRKGRRS